MAPSELGSFRHPPGPPAGREAAGRPAAEQLLFAMPSGQAIRQGRPAAGRAGPVPSKAQGRFCPARASPATQPESVLRPGGPEKQRGGSAPTPPGFIASGPPAWGGLTPLPVGRARGRMAQSLCRWARMRKNPGLWGRAPGEFLRWWGWRNRCRRSWFWTLVAQATRASEPPARGRRRGSVCRTTAYAPGRGMPRGPPADRPAVPQNKWPCQAVAVWSWRDRPA